MAYQPVATDRPDRYRVSVEEYRHYQREGYVLVRGLVSAEEVEAIRDHSIRILDGSVRVESVPPPPEGMPREEVLRRLTRIHMLHRHDAMNERYLLHPRILDVLEALIGPDVLALQTMTFYNPPGLGGQGWHQDAYYITTYPDTLIGAWLALEPVDEENGCLWVAPGSHVEPIYPDAGRGSVIHAKEAFHDLETVEGVSSLDDEANTLTRIAARYGDPVPAIMEPGDVLFFHGHLLHRSYPNRSKDRWRQAFVNHYCNARSWVPWNHGAPFDGDSANDHHILARGSTHLPFARPKFGTPCAALDASSGPPRRSIAVDGGMETVAPAKDVEATR